MTSIWNLWQWTFGCKILVYINLFAFYKILCVFKFSF